jgi:hypothetical protein
MQQKTLDSWGRKINYKYQYNLDVFYNKNEIFYYLLGAFITDGNVFFYKNKNSAKTSLTSKDKDWLISINQLICNDNLVKDNNKTNCSELKIYENTIANILLENGCRPNKSLTQILPSISDDYFRDFIRGCMDGDGSITLSKKKIKRPYKEYIYYVPTCYLCSASKKFILDISEKLNALNLKHYVITLNPKPRKLRNKLITSNTPMYRILFNNKDCYNFLQWAYYPNHKLSMNRKYQEILNIFNYFENKKWGSINII